MCTIALHSTMQILPVEVTGKAYTYTLPVVYSMYRHITGIPHLLRVISAILVCITYNLPVCNG